MRISQFSSGALFLAALGTAGPLWRDGARRFAVRSVPSRLPSDSEILTIIPTTNPSTFPSSQSLKIPITASTSDVSLNAAQFSTAESTTTESPATHTSSGQNTASADQNAQGLSKGPGTLTTTSTSMVQPHDAASVMPSPIVDSGITSSTKTTPTSTTTTSPVSTSVIVSSLIPGSTTTTSHMLAATTSTSPTMASSTSVSPTPVSLAAASHTSLSPTSTSHNTIATGSTYISRFTLQDTSLVLPPTAVLSTSFPSTLAASAGFPQPQSQLATTVTIDGSSLTAIGSLTTTSRQYNSVSTYVKPTPSTLTPASVQTTVPIISVAVAPTVIPASQATPTSLSASEMASNLALAQSYDTFFSTLNFSSPCTSGQIACISGNVGNCDSEGSFVMDVCSTGTSCHALPMPDTKGVYVGCTDTAAADGILGISRSSTSMPSTTTAVIFSSMRGTPTNIISAAAASSAPTYPAPPPASLHLSTTFVTILPKKSTSTVYVTETRAVAPVPAVTSSSPAETISLTSEIGGGRLTTLVIIPVPQATGIPIEKETVTATVTVTATERIRS